MGRFFDIYHMLLLVLLSCFCVHFGRTACLLACIKISVTLLFSDGQSVAREDGMGLLPFIHVVCGFIYMPGGRFRWVAAALCVRARVTPPSECTHTYRALCGKCDGLADRDNGMLHTTTNHHDHDRDHDRSVATTPSLHHHHPAARKDDRQRVFFFLYSSGLLLFDSSWTMTGGVVVVLALSRSVGRSAVLLAVLFSFFCTRAIFSTQRYLSVCHDTEIYIYIVLAISRSGDLL